MVPRSVSLIGRLFVICVFLSACVSAPPQGRPVPAEPVVYPKPAPKPQTRPPVSRPPAPAPRTGSSRPSRPAPSPAVVSLSKQAKAHYSAGRYGDAASKLERAVKIAPRDPALWSDLGRVRYKQERYSQAESLLLKSNSLAGGDTSLRIRNWRLIAQVRAAVGDRSGARTAEQEARHLERGS